MSGRRGPSLLAAYFPIGPQRPPAQRRNPKLRAMEAAGFAIEQGAGRRWEVSSNKWMPGIVDEYRTLREIPADYYLGITEKGEAI